MVRQDSEPCNQIVGIDNDMAYGPTIVRTKTTVSHTHFQHSIEAKNILYCLPLMDEPLHDQVKAHIASVSPQQVLLQWLAAVQQQQHHYDKLCQHHYIKDNQLKSWLPQAVCHDELKLPVRFSPQLIIEWQQRLQQIQQILHQWEGPPITHNQLLSITQPLVHRFYQQILKNNQYDVRKSFQSISNSNYEGLFFENVLGHQLQEKLNSGITLAEALDAENSPSDPSACWTHTVPELVTEWLQHPTYTLWPSINALTTIAQTFPELLPYLPQAWHQESVLCQAFKHKAAPQVIDYLMSLNLNMLARDKDTQQNIFHYAVQGQQPYTVLEALLNKLSKDERQRLLGQQNARRLTSLDLAFEQSPQSVIDMLTLGATYCSSSVALKFYHQYFKKLQKALHNEVLVSLFQQLIMSRPEIEWRITLDELLPMKRTSSHDLAVASTTYGERFLSRALQQQLFDTKGQWKPITQQSNHIVAYAEGQGTLQRHALYFKVYPALPGLEEASGRFTRQLLGFGAPYTDLVKINGQPVMISQGISGDTLAKVLRDHPERLQALDEDDTAGLILVAMLINPEDGKPDNYIVTPHLTQADRYRLVGVDNDQAFVPAIVKTKPDVTLLTRQTIPVAQVKTILYCLDHMLKSVPTTIRNRFINSHPDALLEDWIKGLKHVSQSQQALFASKEQAQAFKDKQCFIGVPFQEGAVRHIYEKFVLMRDLLSARPNITLLELLTKLEPRLAKRYEQALQQPVSVLERFKQVDQPFYAVSRSGSHTTLTKSGDVLKSMVIPLEEKVLESIRLGKQKSPQRALEELQKIKQEKSAQTLQALAARVGDIELLRTLHLEESRVAFLKHLVNQGKILSPQEQEAILNYLITQKNIRTLILPRFTRLDDAFVQRLPLTQLHNLDLRYCNQITNDSLIFLATAAPLLEDLNLGHITTLVTAKGTSFLGGLRGYNPIDFPYLQILNLAQCSNLQQLHVKAPQLTWLNVEQCSSLNDTGLDSLIVHSPQLQILRFKDSAVTEQELRVSVPAYPASLLQNVSAKLKQEIIQLLTTTSLQQLNLSSNQISDTGATALATALHHNSSLQQLDLSSNQISEEIKQQFKHDKRIHF